MKDFSFVPYRTESEGITMIYFNETSLNVILFFRLAFAKRIFLS